MKTVWKVLLVAGGVVVGKELLKNAKTIDLKSINTESVTNYAKQALQKYLES
jgi:hypothetical protein